MTISIQHALPQALARPARTLGFTQASEIAQVYWGVCRHARCYTTFKVGFGGWAELRGGGVF